jgi:hypothetical protein
MSDFITISCPSCGGHLTRRASAATYTCDYCGQRHRVPKEEIEDFGSCPLCKKNDRVEKARVIHYRGDAFSERLAPPRNPEEFLEYRPGEKPLPNYKQVENTEKHKLTRLGKAITIAAAAFFVPATCLLVNAIEDYEAIAIAVSALISLVFFAMLAGAILWLLGRHKEKGLLQIGKQRLVAEWEKQNELNDSRWSSHLDQYNREYEKQLALLKKNFARANQRYDQVYYCYRDDIVFIPGEPTHAPSSKLEWFLYADGSEE